MFLGRFFGTWKKSFDIFGKKNFKNYLFDVLDTTKKSFCILLRKFWWVYALSLFFMSAWIISEWPFCQIDLKPYFILYQNYLAVLFLIIFLPFLCFNFLVVLYVANNKKIFRGDFFYGFFRWVLLIIISFVFTLALFFSGLLFLNFRLPLVFLYFECLLELFLRVFTFLSIPIALFFLMSGKSGVFRSFINGIIANLYYFPALLALEIIGALSLFLFFILYYFIRFYFWTIVFKDLSNFRHIFRMCFSVFFLKITSLLRIYVFGLFGAKRSFYMNNMDLYNILNVPIVVVSCTFMLQILFTFSLSLISVYYTKVISKDSMFDTDS